MFELLLDLGRFEEAEYIANTFLQTPSNNPDSESVRLHCLGGLHYHRAEVEEAREKWKKAFELRWKLKDLRLEAQSWVSLR